MARVTPEQFQEKHQRRTEQALEDIRTGVQNVTVNPCELAANKIDKMRAGIIRAIDSGKTEAALRRVSLEEWRGKMLTKGVDRIPEGLTQAKQKVIDFASDLLPHIDKGLVELNKLADVTLADAKKRGTTWMDHMSKFKRTK